MKLAIIGNCQARPLSNLLSNANEIDSDIFQLIVHLSKNENERSDLAALDEADVILVQLVADNYPVDHVKTSFLKNRYKSKVVVWPNIFFHGQNPDLVYATGEHNKRLISPIDVYHSRGLIELWKKGIQVDEINKSDYVIENCSAVKLLASAKQSLVDLQTRERFTDIKISDYIEENWRDSKLFHTFNHPTIDTLNILVLRICSYLSVETGAIERSSSGQVDWLATIQPPMQKGVAEALELKFSTSLPIRGGRLADDFLSTVVGQYKDYTEAQFVENSYRCYDAQSEFMSNVRFTPSFSLSD